MAALKLREMVNKLSIMHSLCYLKHLHLLGREGGLCPSPAAIGQEAGYSNKPF